MAVLSVQPQMISFMSLGLDATTWSFLVFKDPFLMALQNLFFGMIVLRLCGKIWKIDLQIGNLELRFVTCLDWWSC